MIRSSPRLVGVGLLVLSTTALAGPNRGPDVAVTVIEFEGGATAADQPKLKQALLSSVGRRLAPVGVADPAMHFERAGDDRARILLGKTLGTRLLIEVRLSSGPAADQSGQARWVADTTLFDSEGGELVGSEQATCTGCDQVAFAALFPEMLDRLLRHDRPRAKTKVCLKADPGDVAARLLIDKRPMGTLPFEDALFSGKHEIAVEADGYRPVRLTIVLQRGSAQDIVLPLDRADSKVVRDTVTLTRPEATPSVAGPGPGKRIAGGVLIGVGVIGAIVGGVLISQNGPDCTLTGTFTQCRQIVDNNVPGGVFIGVGVAAIIAGAVTLGVDAAQRKSATAPAVKAMIDVGPSGAMLGAKGRF